MFLDHFGIKENPFSNTPDPDYLFMSDRHQEALAHLQYGIHGNSGFVLLTGEVGAGKTTVCRCLVEQLPDHIDLALCLNPRVSEAELLAAICDELRVDTARCQPDSIKDHMDALNRYLLDGYAKGRRAVLIIDEAQNLTYEALEQVRLLTNLETASTKLLQMILIGQPELRERLAGTNLHQLAQRITARYHLDPMTGPETANYIRHRLQVGGLDADLMDAEAVAEIHHASGGIPRLINSISERSLLGAFARGVKRIDRRLAGQAAIEVLGHAPPRRARDKSEDTEGGWFTGTLLAAATIGGLVFIGFLGPDPVWTLPPGIKAAITDVGQRIGIMPSTAPPAPRPRSKAGPVIDPARIATAALNAIDGRIARGLVTGTAMAGITQPVRPVTEIAATPKRDEPAPPAVPPLSLDTLFEHPDIKGELVPAVIHLFALWGQTTSMFGALNPCAEAKGFALRCFQGRATIEDLRVFDVPALINLARNNERRFAVVTAIADGKATLEVDGRRLAADAAALKPYWSGTFIALWRPLAGIERSLKAGTSGPDVASLRRALDKVPDLTAGAAADDPEKFDAGLKARVVQFQERSNLAADGTVGTVTQMRLSAAVAETPVPSLAPKR